jgi:DNA-directed RNA polymerase specialized sigma24 family protein
LDPNVGDASLAQRIAAQDHVAFTLLIKRHNQLLFLAARSIVRDDAEAEDVLQEAWLHAYRARRCPLKGAMRGRWAMAVSGNWRLTFEFRDGNAYVLDYEDYH